MKVNELRIGNLVIDKYDNIVKVNSIDVNHGDDCVNEYYAKDFSPVLLTDEWLIKMGFDRKYSKYTWQNESMMFNYDSDYNCGLFLAGSRHVNFHCVHEIQNLYFALCGKELEIKL